MSKTPKKQGEESIHHFSHKHELFFYRSTTDDYWLQCVACGSVIWTDEDHLFCERCKDNRFLLHKSCAELPQKLKHPFHQQHSLTLLDEPPWRRKGEGVVYCCACGERCRNFVYECSDCEFYIHSKCAMLFPTTRLLAKRKKLRHPHPLIVCERKIVDCNIVDFRCGGCFQPFDDDKGEIDYSTLIYVCLECHVLLHESCADLPQNITQHPFHPDCTLTFRISSAYDYGNRSFISDAGAYSSSDQYYALCDFCRHYCRLYFQCSDCSIKMDIPCTLLTPCTTTNYKPVGEQKDNGHPHPLIHCNSRVNHYGLRKCGGCYQRLEKSAYYCVSCKMFLNKSCAELPHVIQHPFHPYHPLTLSDSLDHHRGKTFRCNACRVGDDSSFSYRCDLCEFYLHPKCASPLLYPMIYMSELHQDPLAYSDNIPYRTTCSKCTSDTQFMRAGFRCLQCKFDVHDHCFPLLPPTVKTKWHRHPLTLTHAPIKGDPDEGDSDEGEKVDLYCDCCEEKRDLKDPTYYCAKCHVISHVRCVMWEVMDYLQEKSTKVGELCNTKIIVIGEAKAIDSIHAAVGNKDRVEQGDHQDIRDEDFDHIVIGLRNEITAVSTELVEHKAKLEEYQKIYATTSLKLKGLEERQRLLERLSQHIAYKTEFK